MKLILEKYLYLLTEDPQMDAYEENYKKLKKDILDFHKKYNPQKLTVQYANVPKEKIPKDIKKILDDYYKLTEDFSEAGRMKQAYSQFMRGEGPKPGAKTSQSTSNFWDDFFKQRDTKWYYKGKTYDSYSDYKKAHDDWWKAYDEDYAKKHYTFKGKTYKNYDEYRNAFWDDFNKENYTWKGKTYDNLNDYLKAKFRDNTYTWKGRTYKNFDDYLNAKYDINKSRYYGGGGSTYRTAKIVERNRSSNLFALASIAAVVLAVSMIANRKKAKYSTIGNKKCSNLTGKNKEKCMTAYKIAGHREKIKLLQQSLTKANQTTDPEKYKNEIQQEINKTKNRIIRLQKKL